jgi:hypothetical protein
MYHAARIVPNPPRPPSGAGSQKQQFNMRLTGHARALLARLALSKGVSQTDVVEMAIREYAERHGVIDRAD